MDKLLKLPQVCEIAHNTFYINEYGLDAMFLVVGDDKAVLIDTGTGLFNLPELLNTLTVKPVMVVLTHGHVDHAGAIGWFDKVYLHPDDYAMSTSIPYEQRKGYAGMLSMNPSAPVTPEDTVKFDKLPNTLPLKDGDVIDLGGRKLVVYETPGHTPGGLSFLDVNERIFYTGDACNMNTLILPFNGKAPKQSVETLLKTAEKIVSLAPYYDRNYNGHIGYGGLASCRPQAYSVAADMVELCKDILSGKEKGAEAEMSIAGMPPTKTLHALRGAAGIRYSESTIWE